MAKNSSINDDIKRKDENHYTIGYRILRDTFDLSHQDILDLKAGTFKLTLDDYKEVE